MPPPVEPPPAGALCGSCQTRNQAGFRFCVTCGSPLGAGPHAGPAAGDQQQQPPSAPASRAPATTPDAALDCPRCRGRWDGLSRCALCGFSTTDARGLTGTLILSGAEARSRPTERHPPPPPAAGRVVLVGADGQDGDAWPLSGDHVDVGAREGHIVLADDPFLSPRHARLSREGDAWRVTDLASVNGVYLRLRAPRQVRSGDLILLGQQVLRFEAVNDAEQALRPVHQHGTAIFGTPATPCWARLCQRTVEGITRDVFHLRDDETTLGRESADIVFSRDAFLSRHHARLTRTAGGAVLEDLGSSNGTFLALSTSEPVRDGDVLRLGQHMFRVEFGAEGAR